MEARVGGVLDISGNGCVFVNNGGSIVDVVWPNGFTADTLPNGLVVVRNDRGRIAVAVGATFVASGGDVHSDGLACRADPLRGDVMEVDAAIAVQPVAGTSPSDTPLLNSPG